MRLSLTLVLLTACSTLNPTPKALIRRDAEFRLSACMDGTWAQAQRHRCFMDARDYCVSKGMEKSCGEGAAWTR